MSSRRTPAYTAACNEHLHGVTKLPQEALDRDDHGRNKIEAFQDTVIQALATSVGVLGPIEVHRSDIPLSFCTRCSYKAVNQIFVIFANTVAHSHRGFV